MTIPDLAAWDQTPAVEQRRLAISLAGSLPGGFAFEELREYSLGEGRHRIASYDFQGVSFALIPGGTVELGFDPGPWKPTVKEEASWKEFAAEMELDPDIRAFMRSVFSPRRTANVPPCLVEVIPQEVGWQPLPENHPKVQELLKPVELPEYVLKHMARRPPSSGPRTTGSYSANEVIRVIRDEAGVVTATINTLLYHADVVAHIASGGFDLPSADEWEHFCGGGSRTLFRWGDQAPCDRYPTDISPEEARWRVEWVLSDGNLASPAGGFQSDWNFHIRPNAFGLAIASPTSGSELLREPGAFRGGDGGSSSCGGEGFFRGWLPLATSWIDPDHCCRESDRPIFPAVPVARRVLRLA